MRMVLWPSVDGEPREIQLLVQGGREPEVWFHEAETTVQLTESELRKPLIDGFTYSPFDLLMPFVYWDQFEYRGADRVKGRSAQLFMMYPPSEFENAMKGAVGVELAIDSSFYAMLNASVLNQAGDALRTYKIQSFKKVKGQYIIKEIDLVDGPTRDKTRFRVKSAAVDLSLPEDVFDARKLSQTPPPMSVLEFEKI